MTVLLNFLHKKHVGQGMLEVALVTVLVSVAVLGAVQALQGDFEEHIASVAMLDNPGIDTTGAVFYEVPSDTVNGGTIPTLITMTPDGMEFTDEQGNLIPGNPLSTGSSNGGL